MTKRIICALLCVIFALFLIGCGTSYNEIVDKNMPSMFIIVEGYGMDCFRIVYHRDTKVMYAISTGGYNAGNFTVLVNPDGSPMLWKGD